MAAFAVPARAQEPRAPRYIAAAGTRYVVRVTTDVLRDGVQISHDERDYERVVTSSDTVGGEVRATIVDIRGGPTDRLSPEEKRLYLSVLSADITVSYHYILPQRSTSVIWSMTDQDTHLPPPDRIQSLVSSLACDEPTLASFFPIGRVPQVVITCDLTTTFMSTPRPPEKLETTLDAMGPASVTVPAGTFAVQKLRLRQAYATGMRFDATSLFSSELGIAISADAVSERMNGTSVTRTVQHSELLRLIPAAP